MVAASLYSQKVMVKTMMANFFAKFLANILEFAVIFMQACVKWK